MIGETSKHYPDSVQEFVNKTMLLLQERDLLTETDPEVLEGMLCESALQKFFGGEELSWEDDELFENLCVLEIHTQINHLKHLGLVDSIEDENGQEVIWPTEIGKQVLTKIQANGEHGINQ